MESFDNGQVVVPENFQEKILTGKLVKIWPWARGYYRRDLLHTLWLYMENECMTETVFYQKPTGAETPVSTHMDLVEFIAYFAGQPNRLLLIPTSAATGEIIGFSWYDNVILGHTASGNMFYRKKFWGDAAHETTELSLRYGFEILGLKKVWGYSPWLASVKHRAKLGFQEITEIPDAVIDTRNKSRTMFIGAVTKEQFYGRP